MRPKLGEILVQAGVLTPAQIDKALARQRSLPNSPKLGEVILAMGLVTDQVLLEVLSRALGLPAIDLQTANVMPEAICQVSDADARRHLVLPLAIEEAGQRRRLVLAMADPTNIQFIDELQFSSGMVVRPVVTLASQVRVALDQHYPLQRVEPNVAWDPRRQATWGGQASSAAANETKDVAVFRVIAGPARGREFRLSRRGSLDLGRGDKVEVSIPDDMRLSRRHFVIFDAGGAVELVDMNSRNGTEVNREQIRRAFLHTGDVITAGNTTLTVELLPTAG